MAERRPLVEGLKPKPETPRALEEQFVYSEKLKAAPSAAEPTAYKAAPTITRVPFTSRLRDDLAQALKRASLERQLAGIEPNTVQDILESALEPWLRANGH